MSAVSRSQSSPIYRELLAQTRQLAKDGKLSHQDVDKLIDAAVDDKKLSAPERAALKDIADEFASKMQSPELAERLKSFAKMTHAGIRTEVRAAEQNDGVVNAAEARALVNSLQEGSLNASAKYSLAAVMVGARLTPDAREILAHGADASAANPWQKVPDGSYQVVLPARNYQVAYARVEKEGEKLFFSFTPGDLSHARGVDRSVFSRIPVGPNGDFSVHADPLRDDRRRPLSSDWASLKGTVALVDGMIKVNVDYDEKRLGPRVPRPLPDDPACSHPLGGEASGSFYDQDKIGLVSVRLGGTRDPNKPDAQRVSKTFEERVKHSRDPGGSKPELLRC